jgi:putative toxin-antitoxin system antitoxin component (TIGR02293 family)
MLTTKARTFRLKSKPAGPGPGARTLGIRADDPGSLVRQVRAGFAFRRLERLQRAMALPWGKIARLVSIPQRTLTRRQAEGRLGSEESDRVLRASRVFDLAVDLFEGDVAAARQWLQTPKPGLGGEVPIEFAATEAGAREVEHLIACLEHGIFP